MTKIRMTTAQALIKFLNQQFIETKSGTQRFVQGIFTVFGHGNVLGLGQALESDSGELTAYQGRNEQGMAHAAMAFAKQNNRRQIMACTASIGPGSANMLTAAATATANQIPVLLLPSDTFASRQPDPVLQQMEHTYSAAITVNDAFKSVCKYWDRVSRPEQLMAAMLNAMRVLTDPADTGAVAISLPQDVQGEAWEYPESFFQKRIHRIERRLPHPRDITEAADLIIQKCKPVIICGGGVRYSGAGIALKTFAEKFGVPFAETQAGKSAVESSHAYNLGGIGVTGNAAANKLASEADLIIGIGTRFTDFTTGSKSLFRNPEVEFITLNASSFHASKLDATAVVCDAAEGLDALTSALAERSYQTSPDYQDEISAVKSEWRRERMRLAEVEYSAEGFMPEIAGHLDEKLAEYAGALGSTLTQTRVLAVVNDMIPNDAIVVGAAGSLPGDMQRMWENTVTDTYHMEYGFSCMGYEIAGALGVKLAEPDREVYALVGDGSYQMLHSELVTSLQEQKKINIILLDNGGFGCINNLQMEHGMSSIGTEFRYRGSDGTLNDKLMAIDYAASAAGYGAVTYRVTSIEELKAAIRDARLQNVSTLIDVKVLPKTMTHGYGSWWHVGVAEETDSDTVRAAHKRKLQGLERARLY
ncbi:3D-(3,5/4)-trihydroxycyclohexane-1,2-dione acylhydrolase (decyclizing) [Paenibacillus urinalis]|uniref:3D-(3,5/4)-trihydroxycyclohexane-1,2-dione acylhydrolase (decyclizing) n=1 Tax=Paenibacillus TaxID=44249 RepID=UPI0004D9F045|nr:MULTISPECIES: 3D-(3,5/4)-trihydroxycyclohexane-1,2-dione acylhydrolase (decyclizing) [Paenibacillus]WDH96932.1 3D-(3,5/4)-trihydroxycyclohexane-1,2-dione acylhydrolase (decyclizing) [Paenibacillus urinalis]GAK39251.1 myo-inositol catabolism protein IolD [Paenibacillus sp. TCA20]